MFVTIAAALLVSACNEPELVWVHPERGATDFIQDRDTCTARIDRLDADYKALFDSCMGDLGWRQQQM
ncbi:hypothetical protein [Ferrimonas senticii]|uniref:hypothetical protein n=1 Tax=Ferrimonas senticii TaxID=394566 RepID=UPI000410874D|nr:hypothetical protein [Ferrimonas senticii]